MGPPWLLTGEQRKTCAIARARGGSLNLWGAGLWGGGGSVCEPAERGRWGEGLRTFGTLSTRVACGGGGSLPSRRPCGGGDRLDGPGWLPRAVQSGLKPHPSDADHLIISPYGFGFGDGTGCKVWVRKSRLDGGAGTGSHMVPGAHVLRGRGRCFKAVISAFNPVARRDLKRFTERNTGQGVREGSEQSGGLVPGQPPGRARGALG